MVATKDISFACQTYSWQMSGEQYRGRLDHIAQVVAEAGFQGLEPEVYMLGPFVAAGRMQALLSKHDLQLASVAFAAEWQHEVETAAEGIEADKIIRFVRSFPGAKLVLVQLPGADRSELEARQHNAIKCINAVGRRALEVGVRPTVHPNSPKGSVFRIATDYEALFASLDPEIGYTPDVGHVAAGGMEPLVTVKTYRDRIDHIHFKDIHEDGRWAATGEGVAEFRLITAFLAETGYRGWIVLEDECAGAEQEPDAAARHNADFARQALMPIATGGSTRNGADL
jgi:inosose dehydratase